MGKTVAVYGALRSGTTLLRLMLDGHPQLSCPGEMDFLFDHLSADRIYDEKELERNRIYRAHRDLYIDQPLEILTPDTLIMSCCWFRGHEDKIVTKESEIGNETEVYERVQV